MLRVLLSLPYFPFDVNPLHTHTYMYMLYFDLRPEQNAIQGDAPEGSDTFQWQLGKEIAWAEIG